LRKGDGDVVEGVDGENADAGVVGDIKDLLLGEGDVVGVMP
jgi:hypothetical protein